MLEIILFFLFASLVLYVILAGADFGAGILELFSAKKFIDRHQHIIYTAIGPVWEANHIWLILIIVILFSAFPTVYATISTYLHIPLFLMLVGIILRGTTFVFRHYDAIQDNSQKYYSVIFTYSSFLTPLFLGVIAGATILGKINPDAQTFYAAYITPWFNSFSFSVGLLFCAISAFTAAVFLVGEAKMEIDILRFQKMARWSNVILIFVGGLVFLAAQLDGLSLFSLYLDHPIAIISVLLASIGAVFLWWALGKNYHWLARLLAGFQITMVLFGWVSVQYPIMVNIEDGAGFSLLEAAAPSEVQTGLVVALMVGSMLIFPALIFLFKVFKLNVDS